MRASAAVAALLLVGISLPGSRLSAQPPAGGLGGFAEQVAVGYVLVPVTVRSRSGYVDDLGPGDFRLAVDDVPIEFDSFERAADAALRLAVLQDLSGSMGLGDKLAASREAVRCLLEKARPNDRYALASFAGRQLQVEVPFTVERGPLDEAMARWRAYGVTAIHDAVARIPEISASRAEPNVAAVLITDGVENASRLAPEEARALVRRAKIPVYVLGFAPAVEEVPDASDLARYAGVLQSLAAFTGGRYYPIAGEEDLARACVEISIELRSRYVLGFPTASVGEARYRRLRVEVSRSRTRISHRLGYTGPPPADPAGAAPPDG